MSDKKDKKEKKGQRRERAEYILLVSWSCLLTGICFDKRLKFPMDGSSEPPGVRVRVEWVILIAERVQPAWRWQGQGSFS
jgi:hypothetical protein